LPSLTTHIKKYFSGMITGLAADSPKETAMKRTESIQRLLLLLWRITFNTETIWWHNSSLEVKDHVKHVSCLHSMVHPQNMNGNHCTQKRALNMLNVQLWTINR